MLLFQIYGIFFIVDSTVIFFKEETMHYGFVLCWKIEIANKVWPEKVKNNTQKWSTIVIQILDVVTMK